MMNRVSAQSARDRKRDYVDSLEKKVALLEEQVSGQCTCVCMPKLHYFLYAEQETGRRELRSKGAHVLFDTGERAAGRKA